MTGSDGLDRDDDGANGSRGAVRVAGDDELRRLAAIVEHSPDFVAVARSDGRLVYMNRAGRRLVGLADDAPVEDLRHSDLCPEDVLRRTREERRPTAAAEGLVTGEGAIRTLDGRTIPVSFALIVHPGAVGGGIDAVSTIARDISLRKRAEAALRESEQRLRKLFDSNVIGLIVADFDGRVREANEEFLRIVGYGRDDVDAGRLNTRELTPVELRRLDDDALAEMAATGGHAPFEKEFVRKDGTRVPVLVGTAYDRAQRGGLRDRYQHDRRSHGAELGRARRARERKTIPGVDGAGAFQHPGAFARRSHARGESRVGGALGPHAGKDPRLQHAAGSAARGQRDLALYHRRWLDYTGQSLEEALGPEGRRSAVHADDIPRILEASASSEASGEPFEAEYRLRDRSGAYRWFLGRAVAVRDDSGVVVQRFGTATDIEDRKRAEQTACFLAEASVALAGVVDYEQTLRRIAEMAVPAFADWCAVDMATEGDLLRRVAVAHSDSAKIEPARELFIKFPPKTGYVGGIGKVLRTGESEYLTEITDELLEAGVKDPEQLAMLRRLGPRFSICVPLRPRGGTPGVLTFVMAESARHYDEHDLRVAEDLARRATVAIENAELYRALREADRRKGDFLATPAHELRNPLAAMRNALHLMKGPDADAPSEPSDEWAMAERQVNHLTRLVDDLMDVARIERGKMELRRERVPLAAILRHAVETIRPAAEARGHTLLLDVPRKPITLEADPTRLEQVIDNLLTNAVKYTEAGGSVTLKATVESGQPVIRVRDSGIGIAPEKLPTIFEMFTQVHDPSDRTQGGLGIGLGLVKVLVEMHGGTVSAFSAGPGLGCEFTVRLPADAVVQPADVREHSRRTRPRAVPGGRRVLVVDDNMDAAGSLGKVLSRLLDQVVRVVHDGPSALAAAAEFRPEIVLLDIGMPGMDGYEVARRLRSRPETGGTILVALTGWGQEADRRRSAEAGFDRHLVKPVDLDELEDLLRARILEPND